MKSLQVTLIQKEWLSPQTLYLTFRADEDVDFIPGQFLTFFFEKDGRKVPRSYSFATPKNKEKKISFGVKLVAGGVASQVFFQSKKGDLFAVKGPFGGFVFDTHTQNKKTMFIATDTGVMPFYSMLQSIKLPGKTTLLFGARKEEELYCRDFFENLDKENKYFHFLPTLTRQTWKGLQGRVQDHLPDDCSDTTFYVCGRKEMVIQTVKKLQEKGVEKKNIKFERYN